MLINNAMYLYSSSVKSIFFTSIVCANYDLGDPGWLTSSSYIASESSKKLFRLGNRVDLNLLRQ